MPALYRTYRPQTFSEVIGQEAVVRTLTNAIGAGRVRQAYLFAGPRGTGKTSLARILAKGVNCERGPTAEPCGVCNSCVSISKGSSLDVIEMDAASQRGIDDMRELRERVLLQPVEGRSKVYILDEAHQLTKEAWNALLKLIEEPPPHLMFVFCTTERSKVLPTVQSRCQSFDFQRPRLPDIVRYLRWITEGEGLEVPDAALGLVARSARGSFRDAGSTLDQLVSATGGAVTVQDVLQLLGAVEDEVLFRLCDLVVDGDTAGALVFLEELSEQGHDLGRLVLDLLEHLRHLMLVQHTGDVPETLPVTSEARDRLREQANQLGTATVVHMIDLLAVAVEDMRQGGDPRLPLELALVKVTRAASDLSREGIAYRLDRLEQGAGHAPQVSDTKVSDADTKPAPKAAPPSIELAQLQEAWKRSVLPTVEQRDSGVPAAAMLSEAHPVGLDGDTLTVEFPPAASFHRQRAEEPKNVTLLEEALYEVTGRRLALVFVEGPDREPKNKEPEKPATEGELLELVKSTLDAREIES